MYDLDDRIYETYGKDLVRSIDFIRELTAQKTGTLYGGLLVQEAVQNTYPL